MAMNAGLESTCISWNATGTTIASSYGHSNHSSWCDHKGKVIAWTTSIPNFQPSKPAFITETIGCVTSIAFHPIIPSMLAGGTFHGEIIVWRIIENQDPVIASSATTEYSHQEPISQLIWNLNDKEEYELISVGKDGKVLTWDISNKLQQPIRMSVVGTKSIPRLLKVQLGMAPLGIQCISWPKNNPEEYVIGTETGYVLRCTSKSEMDLVSLRKSSK
jgi:WD repeat-containing protein 34